MHCHELQKERFKGESFSYNSKISTDKLEKYCFLGSREKSYMENMFDKLGLTARTYHKILKVARTIADLDGCESIKTKHLNEAICYRSINCSITAEKLFFMPKNELFDILFFTDDDRKIILESRASYDVEKEWILFQQKDIGFVTMEDEAYPDKLRNIHNPPYSLFYIGALPDKSRKSVAIVGARWQRYWQQHFQGRGYR